MSVHTETFIGDNAPQKKIEPLQTVRNHIFVKTKKEIGNICFNTHSSQNLNRSTKNHVKQIG